MSITENEGSADVQSGYMWSSYQDLAWTVTVVTISGEPSVSEGYFILFRIQLQMPTSNSYQTATPYKMLFIRKKKLLQKPYIAYHITGIIMTAFIVLWQETVFHGLNPKVIQSMFYIPQSSSCDAHLTPHSQLVRLGLTYHIPFQLSAVH